MPEFSRSRLKRWIDEGWLSVDGSNPRPRDIVAGGERVTLDAPDEDAVAPVAQQIALSIAYEDEDVMVVDKPAGLVVHPGAGNPDQTLQNALLAHDPKLAKLPRAGIVHRLDKDTTGLLVVARNEPVRVKLAEALAAREIHREYQAVCVGVMTAGGKVDAPIDRHPVDRVRMAVRSSGREAITHYRVIERFRIHTWVRVTLETGRTHQIRLHLSHAGYPLVGDSGLRTEARDPARRDASARDGAARIPAAGAACGEARLSASPRRPRDRGRGSAPGGLSRARRGVEARPRRGGCRMTAPGILKPDWPAPAGVRAAMTTRTGGVSLGPFASFNLAAHVGDDESAVLENRRRLRTALELPSEPAWLEQVHGIGVAVLPGPGRGPADAVVTFSRDTVCAVLVADCLPVILASRAGDRVGVAHAGWRGLAAGVIEAAVAALDCEPANIVAWLGPAIGPAAFEVGGDVRDAFLARDSGAAAAFRSGREGRWLADLPALARRRLAAAGVGAVHGGDLCTYSDPVRFYSYRRDGATGRMAALAWLA